MRKFTRTINDLPNELLACIFALHAVSMGLRYPSQGRRLREQYWWPFRWLNITLVCRRWYDIVFSTAELWRTIKVAERKKTNRAGPVDALEWLNSVLPRTSKAPLELVFTKAVLACRALPIILAQSDRLRTLVIRDASSEDVRNLNPSPTTSVFGTTMPFLRNLDLLYPCYMTDDESHFEPYPARLVEICAWRFPSLRILRLSHLTLADSSLSLFTQLHTLDLRFCNIHGGRTSTDDLLALLESCPELIELQLHLILRTLTPPQSTFKMRKLRKLVLRDAPEHTSSFLSAISLPANMDKIKIVGVLPERHDGLDIAGYFCAILPEDRSAFPWLRTTTAARAENWISYEADMPKLQFRTGQGGAGTAVTLKLQYPWHAVDGVDNAEPGSVLENMRALSVLLAGVPLQRLVIDCAFEAVGRTLERWIEVYAAFPALRELVITGLGPVLEVLPPIACPGVLSKLDELAIMRVSYRPGLVEAIAGMLARRERLRRPRLRRLTLSVLPDGDNDEQDYKRAVQAYVLGSASPADKVEWSVCRVEDQLDITW